MDGDSLPVSAFKDIADGQFETGASAYEKRGTAVMVPEWDPSKPVFSVTAVHLYVHMLLFSPFILSTDEVTGSSSFTY